MMLELIEIQKVASQGMTKPLLCKGSNGRTYYAKGKRATASGLIKEWLAANLARAFNLPIPDFQIAYIDKALVESYGSDAIDYLGAGDVFVSEQIQSATDFKYQLVKKVNSELQQNILLFDLWLENADRTLTEAFSGNPNLLWESATSKLCIIDHNLAFDNDFNLDAFRSTHVFQSAFTQNHQMDIEKMQTVQLRLEKCLQNWPSWLAQIPEEWRQQNDDAKKFNLDATLQRLTLEAQGAIWSKWR